jgi:Phosphate-selective porin O and P
MPPAPPPLLPTVFTGEPKSTSTVAQLAGWQGAFYIRDANDYFRIYPKIRIHLDFTTAFGSGIDKVTVLDGGTTLKSRLFLRRLEPELGGEFLKRWTFNGGFEITQPLANVNGRQELYAATAGQAPTAETARFAPSEVATTGVGIADAWINYTAAPWLNFMIGQYNVPFSLENRTGNKTTSFMERNVAIRGFAVTSNKEIGVTAWGEIADKMFNYEIGVFGGDGQNRPQIDNNADFTGRIFVRPFIRDKGSIVQKAQIGLSAHHGDRDPSFVDYDYSPITSSNGTVLWNPNYKDSLGRNTHVIPSSGQNAIGGELRVPIAKFDIRGEAYYVSNNTREAVEGFQATNTERLGQVHGVSWYAQISAWPFGDAYVTGDPGMVRPTRMDFTKPPENPKKGLEVLALIAGINAAYEGASRPSSTGKDSTYDAKTPGNPSGKVARDITVLQYGLGLNYWHSSYIRTTLNYSIYHTPGSASPSNLATVPGNTLKEPDKDAHLLHELGVRFGVAF